MILSALTASIDAAKLLPDDRQALLNFISEFSAAEQAELVTLASGRPGMWVKLVAEMHLLSLQLATDTNEFLVKEINDAVRITARAASEEETV